MLAKGAKTLQFSSKNSHRAKVSPGMIREKINLKF